MVSIHIRRKGEGGRAEDRHLASDTPIGSAPEIGDGAPENILADALSRPEHISVIPFVDALVCSAVRARASDIHIDPQESEVSVRLRVDGVLRKVWTIPKSLQSEVITRLKILSGLRTDEHHAAQDGRFRIMHGSGGVDVRVSIVPTYYGENAVLRLLTNSAEEFTLDSLGFRPEDRERIERATKRPYGMVLATGPTGSGKTTTLYTLVKMLNRPGVSIITIEDPIEYAIPGINQVQANTRTGLSFAHGLRSFLRQDPNVIMVGEIRDAETAGLAVNTALTGHLLLSTLHTNDAPTTLPRLLDMHVEPYLIASTMNLAIGQRLIRRVCEECKRERHLTEVEARSIAEVLPRGTHVEAGEIFVDGAGCDTCGGTGFRGRIGVYEVMEMNDELRNGVLRKASASEIRTIAIRFGMVPMMVDALDKAKRGLTTIGEILRMRYE